MNSPDTINAPSRDAALDATRTIAIVLMIACHVARLIPKFFYRITTAPQYEFIGLKKTFANANTNGGRTLNENELSALLENASSAEAKSIFSAIDSSGNGMITYREFYDGMDKSLLRPFWQQFSLDIEPLCQGLFLSMVGVSLVYSMRIAKKKGETAWGGRQLRRAIELYIIGMVFFLVQFGWQWPWTLIGHGILLTISMSFITVRQSQSLQRIHWL